MTAKTKPNRDADAALAALRARVAELETANRDLAARLAEAAPADLVQDRPAARDEATPDGVEAAVSERRRAEAALERSRQRLRALASELTLAEARERRRLAAALHDDVGQDLALSRIKLGLLSHHLETAEARALFTELRGLFTEMSQRIRTLTFELSPPVLYQLGLAAAVEWLGENLEREHGVRCGVACCQDLGPLDETLSILLFQSVRELLVNVSKHARASTVTIGIAFGDGRVTVTVTDDGVGFDPQTVSTLSHKRDSFGLFSIGERMHYVNGTLTVDSAPGRGTSVTLSAPVAAAK